jgi:hypothetical protein
MNVITRVYRNIVFRIAQRDYMSGSFKNGVRASQVELKQSSGFKISNTNRRWNNE